MIRNPILPGFNPDPSIIRVGKDYYIATSTFEWFPGVQIHHSKDLVNWNLVARPLNRLSQLDMRGNPDSCGVWAPCLSYDKGIFYLVYTNVRSFDGAWKDTPNFLVTTDDIAGEWSEPIFLSSSGFDGSLFHDDGRKWFLSMLTDHRQSKLFGGIFMQEYDQEAKRLIGSRYLIFQGTELGCTEGPHLYKRNGYYYLLTAEGGTDYGHAISLARSRSIKGPYEVHPQNPIITARDTPNAALQKCGHGDIVMATKGEWYIVFLAGRPLTQRGRCTLGRETAIEEVEWRSDDWLYLKGASNVPRAIIPGHKEDVLASPKHYTERHSFEEDHLNIHFQSLRAPIDETWLTLRERKGFLRLYGRMSLSSLHFQSLIARRVQHFNIRVATYLEFSPTSFQQMAGLVAYYNTSHWFYLQVIGGDRQEEKYLQLIGCDNLKMKELLEDPIDISTINGVYLKLHFEHSALQFYYSINNEEWIPVGPVVDGSILSDDYIKNGGDQYRAAFTGSFVGMCCQDLSGRKINADFGWFEYEEFH